MTAGLAQCNAGQGKSLSEPCSRQEALTALPERGCHPAQVDGAQRTQSWSLAHSCGDGVGRPRRALEHRNARAWERVYEDIEHGFSNLQGCQKQALTSWGGGAGKFGETLGGRVVYLGSREPLRAVSSNPN